MGINIIDNKIKVLIVDDHALVRAGFSRLLDDVAEVEVVGELEDGQQLLNQFNELKPDVVLLDLFMPVMGGMEALGKLMRTNPEAKVIILSMCDSEPYPTQMLQAGAVGYFSKNCRVAELVSAIKQVAAEEIVTDKVLSSDIAKKLALKQVTKEPDPLATLTDREFQVFSFLADGKSVNDISKLLFLSPKTVGTHRTNLMNKLMTKSTVDLTKMAIRYGVVAAH